MKKTSSQAFANLIGSLLFIALGIWAWIQTGSFLEMKGSYVQAATFPRIMIVGMMIFSVILLIQSIAKLLTMKEDDPLAKPAESLNFVKHKEVGAALFVILLCVLFVALFGTLGYVICAAVTSVVIMYLIGKREIPQMVIVSIVVPLVMWFIFYKVLTVNIPMGPLQFIRDFVDKI